MSLRYILKRILLEKLNRGKRLRFLFNYCAWYWYHKPGNHTLTCTLRNGMKTLVHADSDSGVAHLFTENVDYHETAFVRRILQRGDFIIDAGCNVGNRTLALADIIGGGLLLDANEECLKRLARNFSLNGIDLGNYHRLHRAVGDRKGLVRLTDYGGTSCRNKIVDAPHGNESLKEVPMTTIDAEMAAIGNPPCAFVKLDLEGYDLEGLKGARNTLLRNGLRLVRFERWKAVALDPFLDFFRALHWVVFALTAEGKPTAEANAVQAAPNLLAMPEMVFQSIPRRFHKSSG